MIMFDIIKTKLDIFYLFNAVYRGIQFPQHFYKFPKI